MSATTSSQAVVRHLKTFSEKLVGRLLATVEPTRFVAYGSPSSEARAAPDGLGAVYMEEIGGFAR